MKNISQSQIITLLVTVVTITVNALANILPLNGLNTGEISDRFAILFVPDGYVFSIWGIIYVGLIAYTVYQLLPSQKNNPLLNKIAPVYWISGLANTAWIFLWHYEVFAFTWIAMVTILVSLILVFKHISAADTYRKSPAFWLIRLPFTIYLGWISVATIANLSQVLYYFNWNTWGIAPVTWTILLLSVAAILGFLMIFRESEYAFPAVLVWAFIGIAIKQAVFPLVAFTALGLSAALILGSIVSLFISGKKSANDINAAHISQTKI